VDGMRVFSAAAPAFLERAAPGGFGR
jgi:hypothetical protein